MPEAPPAELRQVVKSVRRWQQRRVNRAVAIWAKSGELSSEAFTFAVGGHVEPADLARLFARVFKRLGEGRPSAELTDVVAALRRLAETRVRVVRRGESDDGEGFDAPIPFDA